MRRTPTHRVGHRRTPRICRRAAVGSTSFPFRRVVLPRSHFPESCAPTSGGKVRRFILVFLVLVSFAPTRVDASAGAWVRPVPGALARPFDPPVSRFGAGHLGIDLVARPGTPVVAAAPGVVAFGGTAAA